MSAEQEIDDTIDRITGAFVEIELNRHRLTLSMRMEPPELMTGCCKCGWEWEGGWVPRTRENLDAVEAAMRQHNDDVTSGRWLRREA